MDIYLFIFRNILCSYFLSTNYSHHLIKKRRKKNLNFLNMFPVVVTHMGFLMKYFKAAFSEQFYSFYY